MQQRPACWPAVLLAGAAALFHHKALFSASYSIPWDFRYFHQPLAALMTRAFASGAFPLWDTSTYCGRPLYAVIQAQAFYPPAILTALAGAVLGEGRLLSLMEIHLTAHVALAGVFTYALLRALGLGRAAALTGALIYELGAFFASQAQHMGAVDAAAWMPLAWWGVVMLGRRFSWRRMAALTVALAMSFLAGFTAMTIVVFASTGALALLLAAARLAPASLLLYAAGACAWALLLSAVQLLPTLELTGLSAASGRAAFGDGGGLPAAALASLVWPNRWGVLDYDPETWTLPWNPTWLYLYCGMAAPVLAAAALARRFGRETVVFAALTAGFGIWMFGGGTPVGRAIYGLLPRPVQNALYVEFAMAAFVLALAVLAAMGAEALLAGRGPCLRAAAVALVAAELIWTGSGHPFHLSDDPGTSPEQVDGLAAIPPFLREATGRSYPPSRIDNMGGSPTWTGCSPVFRVPSANGDDPFALTRMLRVRGIFGRGAPWERYYDVVEPASPVLDLLNVEYLVARDGAERPGLERRAKLGAMFVFRNPDALPRFYLAERAHRAANLDAAIARMRAADFDPRREAVVEGRGVQAGGAGTVRVVRYGEREVALETEADGPALLVSSEAWYPGWRAWVNGREQPLVLTNAAFRGLAVPAGRSTVRMRFDPPVLWRGAAVSLAALAALAMLAAVGDNRRSKA